jgi:hypothetical protein
VIQALTASIQRLHPLPSVSGSYLMTILMIQTSVDPSYPPLSRPIKHRHRHIALPNRTLRPHNSRNNAIAD